jgi:antitoxin ParD1/3/4
MEKTTPLTVNITPARESFVRERVAVGRFVTASEVVEQALALLEERERHREAIIDEIRRDIEVGFKQAEAGQLRDGKAVFEEIRSRRPR